MSQDPLLRPDSFRTKPAFDKKISALDKAPPSTGNRNELTRVAKTLAAFAGGEVAYDLALDLVLNEVVQQAREATGATGAAIALSRNGEMECRATAGRDAPELGVRLETESGLSGACLKTGEIQHCSDTETDARVDADACRQLGLRSMVMMPLDSGQKPFGVLEVFSARAHAFGEGDIDALRSLTAKIVASKEEAERGVRNRPDLQENLFVLPKAEGGSEPSAESLDSKSPPVVEQLSEIPQAPRERDFWTSVLAVLVVVAAISLGVMIGWRAAAKTRMNTNRAKANAAAAAKVPIVATATPTSDDLRVSTEQVKTAPTAAPKPAKAEQGAGGGLLVTENGKVIYRLAPSSIAAEKSKGDASENPASRLVHRVAPEYPAAAKAKHIQGRVVMDIQVLNDGGVGNVEVVYGNPLLTEAAVNAVRQWKYQPYLVDGRSVESQTRVTINFMLARTN
jgi:TonB family protein